MVWKLYGSHAHPFTRVVCGIPPPWDASTVATRYLSRIELAVWSPCNRFIAITHDGTGIVDILDSVHLHQLQTLDSPQGISTEGRALAFSPDGCILTCASGGCLPPLDQELFVVSWDLQTGGIIGTTRHQGPALHIRENPSITYSVDGKMVGVSYRYHETINPATIFIFVMATGSYLHSYLPNVGMLLSNNIWTHGKSMQFATISTTNITIWEVGFTPHARPTQVKTLLTPDSFNAIKQIGLQLLPTPYRLALTFRDKVLVWDGQNSKYLLYYEGPGFNAKMTFSSDGHFFACQTTGPEIYLWRESPTGYILHKILSSDTVSSCPLFSQNGNLLITFGAHVIQSWHTRGPNIPPPSSLIQAPQSTGNFVLDFSPNGILAVVAMQKDNKVKVLKLKSSALELTINVGMEVYGLSVIGNAVIVIGDWKIRSWSLPVRGYISNPEMGLEDCLWTTNLSGWRPGHVIHASANSQHVAFIVGDIVRSLYVYNASTGEGIGHGLARQGVMPWFAPYGHDLWCAANSGIADVWRVGGQPMVRRVSEQGALSVHRVGHALECPPGGYPWGSYYGYQVTDDWWILGPDGKRLLMLPPPWQSDPVNRMWKEQFLALVHQGLSEPIILELDP